MPSRADQPANGTRRGGANLADVTNINIHMVDSGWDALEALDATVLRDRSACEHAWRLGRTADFRLGDLAATGLGDGSVDAVLCVDAIQFAQQPNAAYCELQRVWGPLGQDDERLPAACGGVDLAAGLTAVGFSNIEV